MRKTVPDAETLEKIKAVAADIITAGRILFSLFLFALPPSSAMFAILYLLCGLTDILDGFIARRLHTESRAGEQLDSIADLFFAIVYAVKILPVLCLPDWIWIWTALIAVAKLFGIIKSSRKERRFRISHSNANKLTGLLIFFLPLGVRLTDVIYTAAAVCTVATIAVTEEIFGLKSF